MDKLTRRWIDALESVGAGNPVDFIEAVGGIEQYRKDLVQIYEKSGNRLFLIELFTAFATQATDDKMVQIPLWLFHELTYGFSVYLNAVKHGLDSDTLETALGITDNMKTAISGGYLSKEAMKRQVHRLRYHFEIQTAQACYIVYEANRDRLARLTHGTPPTQRLNEQSFLDHYHRKGAQSFASWKKEAIKRKELPSKERQADILRILGPELAERVKKAAKLIF
jgi:hypothetical protein